MDGEWTLNTWYSGYSCGPSEASKLQWLRVRRWRGGNSFWRCWPRCLGPVVWCCADLFFPLFSSGCEPDTHQSLRRTYRMVANARSPTALVEFVPLKAANAMHDMVKYDDIEPLWGHRKPGLGVTLKYEQLMMGCPSTEWALDPNLPKAVLATQRMKGHRILLYPKELTQSQPISGQALENLQGSFYSYECLMVPISNIFSIVIYKERHVITAVGLDLWDGCKPLRIAAAAAATFGGPQLFFLTK